MSHVEKVKQANDTLQLISKNLKEFTEIMNELEEVDSIEEMDIHNRSTYIYLQILHEQYISQLQNSIDYMEKEVLVEGKLHLNINGKFEVEGHEIENGDSIELLLGEDEEKQAYQTTTLEYAGQYGGGYYAYHYPNFKLEGAMVRIRQDK
ncbi:DUF5348 domain-containing protein [Bacillus sp. FJAT-45350]|uniref:DUF5348 domain-containing protein n=1 Tax=Bacillus sp. FJAT-45350 TaxID=2011014 RepID=UPI000BB706C5|nr:DUF5348 domain-containing protein [Bacillus sp. FJAT-45350]